MKTMIKTMQFRLPALALLLISSAYSFAQDSSTTSETHTSSSSVTAPDTSAMWYSAPWVWVAGVIVLILILFAIFAGNNSSKTRVKRTTTTTTEIIDD